MTDQDWANERAKQLYRDVVLFAANKPIDTILTALREAEERGRNSLSGQVALWNKGVESGRLAERQAIEARLRQPDDEMIDALNRNVKQPGFRAVLIALADALFPPSKECWAEQLDSSDPDRIRWVCPRCGPNISGPCNGPPSKEGGP
jgi:hypothetical protein